MNDKTELLIAVDNYDTLTYKHQKILKTIINLAINDTFITTYVQLTKLAGISLNTTYSGIAKLEKEGCITISKKIHEKPYTFKLNHTKLDEIILFYQKKKSYLKNKSI